MLADVDPETGNPVSMNLMTDAREASLKTQAISAIMGHEQARDRSLAPADRQDRRIRVAGLRCAAGAHFRRPLAVAGGPPALGAAALRDHKAGVLGDNDYDPVFGLFTAWKGNDYYRSSVARGADIFHVSPVLAARCRAHQLHRSGQSA